MVNVQRVRKLNNADFGKGSVVYWMSRDQRVADNWALLFAQQCALDRKVPLVVVFCLANSFLGATERQYDFMLRGLEEVEKRLAEYSIPFILLRGEAPTVLPQFVAEHDIGAVITDFSPLRIGRQWREAIAAQIAVSLYEVDTHNIIPAWVTSQKQEFGAYTIRPKIHRLLGGFIDEFPDVVINPYAWTEKVAAIDWSDLRKNLKVDTSVPAVSWIIPGEKAALAAWEDFLEGRLEKYGSERNFPDKQGQSNLSPYLHFGHLSAQRIVLDCNTKLFERYHQSLFDVMHKETNGSATQDSMAAFLEELVVRRELSDNFCLYNPHYDSVVGFPDWAKKTIEAHRNDPRETLYTRDELEQGKTHDELWNASQKEMVVHGKMHGYMRMYWAKKILEWTESPEQAMEYAIYLNDRYELDGRDPNGYTGIAWSIGGVHDRAWFERPVFGKIRYMNYNGAKSKFDIKAYIQYVAELEK